MNSFRKKIKSLFADNRSFSKRLLIALASNILLAFTLIFYGPCEIFLCNMTDFSFMPFDSMVLIMGAAALIYIVAATGIMMLLKGKLFDVVVTLPFSFALCSFIQCNYLNSRLGTLDGTTINWNETTKTTMLNLLLWLVIFIIPIAVRYFSRKAWTVVLYVVTAFIMVVQISGFIMLLTTADFSENVVNKGYLSDTGLNEVSDKNNVIVLLVDNFDNSYIDEMQEQDPNFLEALKGFTRYTNCTSLDKYTQNAVPYLLTGEKTQAEEGPWQYPAIAYGRGTFLQDIEDLNCRISLYTDSMFVYGDSIKYAYNYVEERPDLRITGLFRAMMTCVLYRDMPYALKPSFWYYTDDIAAMALNNAEEILSDGDIEDLVSNAYTIDDPQYYQTLLNKKLETVSDDYDSYFNFIHMTGAHEPYVMNENAESDTSSTLVQQCFGSFKIVLEYLDQLDAIGAYDDSTIIIMADHGIKHFTTELIEPAPSPILFVKPAGKTMDDPYTETSAPVTHEDFHATVLNALGGDGSSYGRAFDEIGEDEDRPRDYFFWKILNDVKEQELIQYVINGDVRDLSNWTKVGIIWKNY